MLRTPVPQCPQCWGSMSASKGTQSLGQCGRCPRTANPRTTGSDDEPGCAKPRCAGQRPGFLWAHKWFDTARPFEQSLFKVAKQPRHPLACPKVIFPLAQGISMASKKCPKGFGRFWSEPHGRHTSSETRKSSSSFLCPQAERERGMGNLQPHPSPSADSHLQTSKTRLGA